MKRRPLWGGLIALLALCLSTADSQAALPPEALSYAEDQLLAKVFEHTEDQAFACSFDQEACQTAASNLSFMPGQFVPDFDDCVSGEATLKACYKGAVRRLQKGLDTGEVLWALDAAYRYEAVLDRAPGEPSPIWMGKTDDLLQKTFNAHGIDLDALGNCKSGDAETRYRCIGDGLGPSREAFRGLINLIDQHNDVLVHHHQITDFEDRMRALIASASGPVFAVMQRDDLWTPTAGPAMQRIDLMGKLLYMATAMRVNGDAQALLGSIKGREPLGGVAPNSQMMMLAAVKAGMIFDPSKNLRAAIDPDLFADIWRLADILQFARILPALRVEQDDSDRAYRWQLLITAVWWLPRPGEEFDIIFPTYSAVSTDLQIDEYEAYLDPCGWFNIEDVIVTWLHIWTEAQTTTITIPEMTLPGPGEIVVEESTHEITEIVTLTELIEVNLGQLVLVTSIRDAYRHLLDADDLGESVDLDGNEIADIDHDGLKAASMAAGGIHAGRSGEGCFGELATVSGGYDNLITSANCAGADCESNFGAGTELYLPYPIAARLCPKFLAQSVGMYTDDAPMTVNDGALACTTPWQFTRRVSEFLADDQWPELRALMHAETLDGGGLGGLLADFANEALILALPGAGMLKQQADLASVGVVSECANAFVGGCNGLDVMQARLDDAHYLVSNGLGLWLRFNDIELDAVTLNPLAPPTAGVGAEIIPGFSAAGLASCGNCAPNSREELRALSYRRAGDAVLLYGQVQTERFEVLWRKLDDMNPSCVVVDENAPEGYLCDSGLCPDECALFAQAEGIVAEVDLMADNLLAVFETHQTVLDDNGATDLSAYAGRLAAYIDGVQADLFADFDALLGGVSWLGEKEGRWRIEPGDNPGVEFDGFFAEVEAEVDAFQTDYEQWIAGYYNTLSQQLAFAQAFTNAGVTTDATLSSMCADATGALAINGCGVGTEWTGNNPLAASVNNAVRTRFCELTKRVDGVTEELGVSFVDPADPYMDFITTYDLPQCPRFKTPDIVALKQAGFTGSLMTELASLESAMLEIKFAVEDLDNYVQLLQNIDELIESYTNFFAAFERQQAWKAALADGLICAAEIIGGIAATVGSYGGGAAVLVVAILDCSARFIQNGALYGPDDKNISPHDINYAAWMTNMTITQSEQIYALSEKIQTVVRAATQYQTAAQRYQSAELAFKKELARADGAFDALVGYQAWMDPTVVHFENQELRNLKASFRQIAGVVQDMHRLMEYDTGNPIPTGRLYVRQQNQSYYLPTLAQITLLSTHGGNLGSALSLLESNTADGSDLETTEPGAFNMVSMASLLAQIYDDFRTVYTPSGSQRPFTDAWIGSAVAGVGDTTNPGERAMLGDSRFYDSTGQTESGCPEDTVDLADYCAVYQDTQAAVVAGTCVDISAMSSITRLDLAWLDHMLRGEGVETFDCNENGGAPSIGLHPAGDHSSGFGLADLGTIPPSGDWYRDLPNGMRQAYYDSQTRTARAVLDRYFDAAQDGESALPTTISLYPGSYAVLIDMSGPSFGAGETSVAFDPELDLLSGGTAHVGSMAEQIEGIALACTAANCGVAVQQYAGLALLGDGFQGTRCRTSLSTYTDDAGATRFSYTAPDGTARQEQLRYRMDHAIVRNEPGWTFSATNPNDAPELDAILGNPAISGVGNRPLHANSMFLVIGGHLDANGQPVNSPWVLYRGSSPNPRIRLAVRYSYYNTDPDDGADNINIGDFLPCGDDSLSEVIQ